MVGVCRRVRSLKVRVFSSLGVVFAPYPLTTTISYTAPYSYPPLTTLLYLSPCLHSSRSRPVKPNVRPITFGFNRRRRPIGGSRKGSRRRRKKGWQGRRRKLGWGRSGGRRRHRRSFSAERHR